MTDDKTFTQVQLDQIVQSRVQAKDQEIERLQGQLGAHKRRILDVEARAAAARARVRPEAADRAMRLADLDAIQVGEAGEVDRAGLDGAFRSVLDEFREMATPIPDIGGGSNPANATTVQARLTRDQVKRMSPEQINERWEEVQRVLTGQ